MCGRFVSPEQAAIERFWNIGRRNQPVLDADAPPFPVRYNVAPQQGNPANYIPVIRESESGELEWVRMQWWLLPHWAKESRVKYSTFNARVENIANAASFRVPLKRSRCIVPALGWYEWQELPDGNLPWYLYARNGDPMGFAALWDRWEREGEVIESCSLVVGPANARFMPVHDRMPFALTPARQRDWMRRDLTDARQALPLLTPNPDDDILFHRVDHRVSNARNNGPELTRPLVVAEPTKKAPDPPRTNRGKKTHSNSLPLDFDES